MLGPQGGAAPLTPYILYTAETMVAWVSTVGFSLKYLLWEGGQESYSTLTSLTPKNTYMFSNSYAPPNQKSWIRP